MTDWLRVAAVQMELRREPTLQGFRQHVEKLVDEAAAGAAELVVFPEMSTTGLIATHSRVGAINRSNINEAYRDVFPALTDDIVAMFVEMATAKGLWICGGSHWRLHADGSYRNTAYLAHPDGSVDSQDKLHLTWPEEAIGTQAGEWIEPFRVGAASVAIQICADVEFPEVTRAMALKGVDVVLCPSLTWNRRGANRVRYSCLARSVEQQVFVVQAPMVGTHGIPADGPLRGTGRALVTTPIDKAFGIDDGVLAEANVDGETVIWGDLDLSQVRRSRLQSDTPGLRQGRPDLYERLMHDAVSQT